MFGNGMSVPSLLSLENPPLRYIRIEFLIMMMFMMMMMIISFFA